MMLPLKVENFTFTDADSTAVLGFVMVFVVLAALALFVMLLSKVIRLATGGKKATEKPAFEEAPAATSAAPVTAPQEESAPAEISSKTATELPYTPGYVTLDGVSEQDAAVVMAIVSDKTGIPLERLCFKSIRRFNQQPELTNIEDQDAAVIMAIVANKTGISLDNLCFNSIKLVEE